MTVTAPAALCRLSAWLTVLLCAAQLSVAPAAAEPGCDRVPAATRTSDYALDFEVPPGLMPDPQFDAQPARIAVLRVQPVYANPRCPDAPVRAAVLIHGRTLAGPVAFDLQTPAPEGGSLSVQQTLARAGIDTFAPSLLGYGHSTRFPTGLEDPANASLRPYAADGSCAYPEGCDHSHNPIFGLDQQGTLLDVNPLAGQRRPHSSQQRFARTDVWVRDVRQVIGDAVARAQPSNGRVTLIGYSLGAQIIGRAMSQSNPVLPEDPLHPARAAVERVVFLAQVFGGSTEETVPPGGFASFPLTLNPAGDVARVPPDREAACTGRILPGTREQRTAQIADQDPAGARWGAAPGSLIRLPTFSGYGWNADVAAQSGTPTLIVQGLDDITVPGGAHTAATLYDALPPALTNKVLMQLGCASHDLLIEGCTGARCAAGSAAPYGAPPGQPWPGPHATVTAALIEWITAGTFDGRSGGRFRIDDHGVVAPDG